MEKEGKIKEVESFDKGLDNTTAVATIVQGDDDEIIAHVATLLGPKFSLPKAGVIRPGIMKLKSGASSRDKVLYEQMLSEGATWDEIDRELGIDSQGKSKLIPANVDYFTVRPGDCQNPKSAEEIYKLYADKDGKLRSFPVWFPVNEWWNIIPHSLRCFSQSGIRFRSAFREKGRRVCEYPLEVEPGKRVFGGRPWGERPCEPDTCKEYQTGECKFGGVLQFYIPGIKGIGVWVLPTTSWYSLVRIKSALEAVAALTGGRLARIFINGQTPFVLRKVFDEVSRIDPQTGKSTRQAQWLIDLEVQVDMLELVQFGQEKAVAKRGLAAASILNGAPSSINPVKATVKPVAEGEALRETTEEIGKLFNEAAEAEAKSKPEAKLKPKAEPKAEPKPEAKAETKAAEAKAEPEPKVKLTEYADEADKIFNGKDEEEDVFIPEEPEKPEKPEKPIAKPVEKPVEKPMENPDKPVEKPTKPENVVTGTIKAVSGNGKGIKIGESWYNIVERTKKNIMPEKGMTVKVTYVQGSKGSLFVDTLDVAS